MSEYQTKSLSRSDIVHAWKALDVALCACVDVVQQQIEQQKAEIERLRKYNEQLLAEREQTEQVQTASPDAVLEVIRRLESDNQHLRSQVEVYKKSRAEHVQELHDAISKRAQERELEAPTSLIERVQEDSAGPLQAALQERMRVDAEEALAFATGLG